MKIDLDEAIKIARAKFSSCRLEDLIMSIPISKPFCAVVIHFHGSPVNEEIILQRLLELSQRHLLDCN